MHINLKNNILIIIVFILLTMLIGYSLFNTELNVVGEAKAKGSFSIVFYKIIDIKEIGSKNATVQIQENKERLSVNIPNLEYPGSYVEVKVLIKNEGTTDAILTSVDVTEIENDDIEITYSNLDEDKILRQNEEKELTIKIKWKDESNVNSSNLSFSIKLNYKQLTDKDIVTTTHKTYQISQEVCLSDECFYIISDNGDTIDMLAKYNLNTSSNKQSSNYTNISFSNSNYWVSNGSLLSKYGTSYPVNIFDNNSSLYNCIENYNNYLKDTLNYKSVKTTIIDYNKLNSLGCNASKYTCSSAYNFVYAQSYWTATAKNVYNIWYVDTSKSFDYHIYSYKSLGVRPLVTINKEDIE